jgi:hypothetical protein
MRYSFRFLCLWALCFVPIIGCGDTNVTVYCGTGGSHGTGGSSDYHVGPSFPCSEEGIRDAIAQGGGPYAFACNGPTTVVTDEEIVIDNDVVLDGRGNLTVDGNRAHRVFSVIEDVTVTLRGFAVTGGVTSEAGGGILNQGTLMVTNSNVSGNVADGNGGGIDNHGVLTLKDSTVSGNSGGSGGGIYVGHSGTLTVTNSTLSGNTTQSCGGGIDVDGRVTVTSTTISGNASNDCGGGLFNQGSLTLASTIVSGNTANDCDGEVTSNGYNLESPGDTCGFGGEGDQASVPADQLRLGPLADNGGLTMTHALEPGSVAIDQIPDGACEVGADQRGEPRPTGGGCDVGSFEVQ